MHLLHYVDFLKVQEVCSCNYFKNKTLQVWNKEKKEKKIYLRRVQCLPFHPCEQTQVPFLHCPCSEHLTSHGNWSQRFPVHPGLQRQRPVSQIPFEPQSRLQTAIE